MKNLLPVIRRRKHKGKRAHALKHVITTLNVIGWFRLQLRMWLAYWTYKKLFNNKVCNNKLSDNNLAS